MLRFRQAGNAAVIKRRKLGSNPQSARAVKQQDKMENKFARSSAGQKRNFGGKAGESKPFGKQGFAGKPRRDGARSDRPSAARESRGAESGARPRYNERPAAKPSPRARAEGDKAERIAKRLARAGIASRREAETMIAAGRIAVNGTVLDTPAFNVRYADKITVDGAPLPVKERTRLWLYHKPAGLITSARDERGRATIFDSLPAALPRVVSVGRLDMNTEGLLLLTNDGGLARILELPSTGWVRHYRVRVHGKVSQEQLDSLKTGIAVDGVFYGGAEAVLEREQGSNAWLSVSLREGKNREIKNILGALGLSVTRLIRTSFGPFRLAELASGMVMEVRGRILRDQLGEKLAEEAELDFAAPIIAPFPNAPVATRPAHSSRFADSDFNSNKAARRSYNAAHEDNADFAGRRLSAHEAPEEGWISSSPGRRAVPAAPAPMPRRATRSANVWHAPGSKARSVKRGEEQEERRLERGERKEQRGGRAFGRRESGQRFDRDAGEFRVPREERESGARRFADKKPYRPYGEGKAEGERQERGGFSRARRESGAYAQSERKLGGAEGRKTGTRRDFDAEPGGFKPRAGKPLSGGKSAGGRSFTVKPHGGKPINGKPRQGGFKPKSFKPRGR